MQSTWAFNLSVQAVKGRWISGLEATLVYQQIPGQPGLREALS